MSDFLTKKERKVLRRQHRLEHERRYADRIKALLLWDEGWTFEEISHVLLLDEKTIRRYRKWYEIELHFLPPYAPNLNLIERLWKFFKKKVLANRYYESFLDFQKACRTFFKGIEKFQPELRTLLRDKFQIIDPVF